MTIIGLIGARHSIIAVIRLVPEDLANTGDGHRASHRDYRWRLASKMFHIKSAVPMFLPGEHGPTENRVAVC